MATDTTHRCAVCLCYLDEEDLFCANCGTENPYIDGSALDQLTRYTDHHSYDCEGCGASMSYDASSQSLRCPFCGSTRLKPLEARQLVQCDWVVPLSIGTQAAHKIFREWLGRGFWRPDDAARSSQIGEIAAVYVPFWIFEASADTKWTADSSPAPAGCRGDWHPVSGQNRAKHRDILVGASSILTLSEVDAIGPFDLQHAVRPDEVDLVNAVEEVFRLPRKHARPIAQAVVEERERQMCASYVPGRARRVKVNVRIEGMIGRPVLLPIWILAYRYKNAVHRVLINGQSGKIAGSAPFSYGKLVVVGVVVIAVFVAMLLMFGLIAAISS